MNTLLIACIIVLASIDRIAIRRIEELKREVAEIRKQANDIY